jgi:hypothetical protein
MCYFLLFSENTGKMKINPLLDKPEIYDYDENTGKIKIKNLKEWKKIINEIKNDIRERELIYFQI